MSRRRIYSYELKLNLIELYQSNQMTVNELVDEFHVDKTCLKKWIRQYKEHGKEGLKTKSGTYSGEFKISVVEYMHNTGSSPQQTAIHFNIPSKDSVLRWERIYYEEGKEALCIENRGRASKVGTKRPRKTQKNVNTNEDLLAEVQRLRMENEYLKKLNALVQEREKSKKPTK